MQPLQRCTRKKAQRRVNIVRNNFDYVMLTVSMLQALQAWLPYRSLIKESIKRDGHAASVYTIVDTPVKTRDTQLTRAALSIRSVSNSRCNLQKPRSPTFAAIGAALTAPFANSNYHAEQNVC